MNKQVRLWQCLSLENDIFCLKCVNYSNNRIVCTQNVCAQRIATCSPVAETGTIPPGNMPGERKWAAKKSQQQAKPEIRLTPGKGLDDLTCSLDQLISQVVTSNKVLPGPLPRQSSCYQHTHLVTCTMMATHPIMTPRVLHVISHTSIHTNSSQVVAFIKGTRAEPQCGFSFRVVNILNEVASGDYEVVNVLDEVYNPGLREAIKSFSQWPTIPQLYVDGDFVGMWCVCVCMTQQCTHTDA